MMMGSNMIIATLSLLLINAVTSQSPTPEPTKTLSFTTVNFDEGFDCDAGSGQFDDLTLNDGPRAYPRLVPLEPGSNLCFLQMTTDDTTARGSSAFLQYRFKEGNQYNFKSTFTYRMFGTSAGSADGFTFVIHEDPRGKTAQGGIGNALGVYGPNVISPALVVEFDTFKNAEDEDSFENAIHVKTVIEGIVTEIVEAKANDLRTTEDERREAIISYEDGRLQVLLDGRLTVNLLVSLRGVLSKREVYAGFTAGTGDEGDFHDIFTWTLTQDTAAPTDPPDPTSAPSRKPSIQPSFWPSSSPSAQPTLFPSSFPSSFPSHSPSATPSAAPQPSPTPPSPTPPSPTPPTPSSPECTIPIPLLGPLLCLLLTVIGVLIG